MQSSCTLCHTELETRYYEGVAVQFCKDCMGIFLSERKLAIIEGCHATHDTADALPRRRRTDHKPCPQCQSAMFKVKHGEQHPVFIDYCDQCHGIWLERCVLSTVQGIYEQVENEQRRLKLRVA